jgi:hypothetical protein
VYFILPSRKSSDSKADHKSTAWGRGLYCAASGSTQMGNPSRRENTKSRNQDNYSPHLHTCKPTNRNANECYNFTSKTTKVCSLWAHGTMRLWGYVKN